MTSGRERNRYLHYLGRVWLREGGVARVVLDTCSLLASRGHEVTLLTSDAEDVPPEWLGANNLPRTVVVPPPRLLSALPAAAESAVQTADVIHLHTPWGLCNAALARRARQSKIPYIVSTHGMLDQWSLRQKWLKKRLFLALVGRRFLQGAARVHFTAAAELEQAVHFLRPGSGIVIPYPMDLSSFAEPPDRNRALREYPELAGEMPRLLFLSRLHPKKRPDLLIEAAAILERAGQTCQVILAGPGEPAYVAGLRQLARECILKGRVVFTGMVHGAYKSSLLQLADVLVLPTSQENFGIVLVEAMAAGTPVITTRGVDIWQELHSAGALLVEQETAGIATAIQSLIEDLPSAKKRGQLGRKWVLRELNVDRVIRAYERMYRDVCATHPGAKM